MLMKSRHLSYRASGGFRRVDQERFKRNLANMNCIVGHFSPKKLFEPHEYTLSTNGQIITANRFESIFLSRHSITIMNE